jgi:acyl phosphate:glycerol-3-phosphate acyltransferase
MGGNVAAAAGCAAGYLIGSVPFGLIVGKVAGGVDVRDVGSGNIGTTNVLRAAGAKAGALTFALDVAKGAAAVGVARRLGADPAAQAAAGLAACVGHSWPAFARFRGGKAVATAFGGLLIVAPEAAAFATVAGLGTLALTRTVSMGSLAAAAAAPLGGALESRRLHTAVPFVFSALAATLVVVRHAPNIRRLLRGEEPQLPSRLFGGS